ncbi:hypothetical protein N0V91_008315 [Didymella pomorum]|uniref:BTB domain-containing protein n=1 Tax=Didymella pomorum TaxID=749634 RepID=A0A9W8ZBJ8_9PLEO|nr:hypothetical protein N0V91_008315 [Didymella pomorum]
MSANVRASSAARGELVNIRVGNDPVVYKIHKDPLLEHSEYFKNALNGSWSESRDGIAPLEDVDQRDFIPDYNRDWLPVAE